MRARAIRSRSSIATAFAACLVLVACGNVPAGTGGTAATAGPTVAGEPGATIPPAGAAAVEQAATVEVGLVQQLRAEVGIAKAIGADGPAVVTAIDSAEQAFGEATIAKAASDLSLELSASGGGVRLVSYRPRILAAWDGINTGRLTHTVANYLAIASLLMERADATADYPFENEETKKETVGGVSINTRTTIQMLAHTGGAQLTFDVQIATNTEVSTTAGIIGQASGAGSGHLEVNGCPDAAGSAPGKMEIKVSEQWSGGNVDATSEQTISGDFELVADDAAKLAATRLHGTTSGSETGGEGGDWTAGGTFGFGTGETPTTTSDGASDAQVKRTTGSGVMLLFILGGVASQAEAFWRSGKCIEVTTSEDSRSVDPKEQVTLTVDARHKFDGSQVKGPITPIFSGTQSLSPTSPVDPGASLTFVAGDQAGDAGTISLRQTSRRGIGTKDVTFTVGSSGLQLRVTDEFGVILGGGELLGAAGNGTEGLTGNLQQGADGTWRGVLTGKTDHDIETIVLGTSCKGHVAGTQQLAAVGTFGTFGTAVDGNPLTFRLVLSPKAGPSYSSTNQCDTLGGEHAPNGIEWLHFYFSEYRGEALFLRVASPPDGGTTTTTIGSASSPDLCTFLHPIAQCYRQTVVVATYGDKKP